MCELQFNEIWIPALLIEKRARHRAKAVRRHFLAAVTDAPQSCAECVVTQRSGLATNRWEDISAATGEILQLLEDRNCLTRKRNHVLLAHFHALGGNAPIGRLKGELAPLRAAEFTRAN